ncbi:MAG: hypothetical protein WCG47_27980 [Dermatophilaceae bacterium]
MSGTALEVGQALRRLSPAAEWTRAARWGAAAALSLGGLLWMLAEVTHLDGSGVDFMQWVAANPTLAGLTLVSDFVGTALLMFALPVWLLLARQGSPRLAWAGAIAGVFGMTAQAMIHGVEVASYIVSTDGRIDKATFDSVLNGSGGGIPFAVFMVMFLGGAFVGTALTMVALWRARTLPRGALVLWLAFLVANLVPVRLPTTILAAAALCWMAVAIVRAPSTRLP